MGDDFVIDTDPIFAEGAGLFISADVKLGGLNLVSGLHGSLIVAAGNQRVVPYLNILRPIVDRQSCTLGRTTLCATLR